MTRSPFLYEYPSNAMDGPSGFKASWASLFSAIVPALPFLMGARIWISLGWIWYIFGIVSVRSFIMACAVRSAISEASSFSPFLSIISKKKSFFGSESSITGKRPSLILWALVMMWLSAAWRKIFVSRTTGNTPLSMISFKTVPGPTEGSWLISPISIRRIFSGTAFNRLFIRRRSTMELSSMIRTSPSSGCSSLCSKVPEPL